MAFWEDSLPCLLLRNNSIGDVEFMVSHRQSKYIAIDEQPDDHIVHLDGSRKADRLAHQPLDPGPQRHMFTFDLLRIPLLPGLCSAGSR
jgi:hypothetical protein